MRMETMQDLLEKVQEFAFHDFGKEEAKKLFGWDVAEILVNSSKEDENHILIIFNNNFMLFIRYFLNLDPSQTVRRGRLKQLLGGFFVVPLFSLFFSFIRTS